MNFPQPPEQKQKHACSKNLLLQDTFIPASEHAEEGRDKDLLLCDRSPSLCVANLLVSIMTRGRNEKRTAGTKSYKNKHVKVTT